MFDSGVGGVSVLYDVQRQLPAEDIVYVADSAYCPYGGRSAAEIIARAEVLTEFLIDQGCKLIVVACNTATIAAVEWLRAHYTLPFVGMEPAVKPAVQHTQTGVIGVLATGAALSGERFHRLAAQYDSAVRMITQPCPGLAEQVEAGDLDGPLTRMLVEQYTLPLLEQGCDTLVLGCTHYPLLRPLIAAVAGPDVALIDTGAAVARQIERLLKHHGLQTPADQPGHIRWYTSGDPLLVQPVIARLWPHEHVDVAAMSAAPQRNNALAPHVSLNNS